MRVDEEDNLSQMSSNEDNHSEKTYKVRKGTVNKGEIYETIFVANVVFKLVLDDEIEDFSVYSNAADFLPFDDLVIETQTIHGFKERIAIQLKHKDGSPMTLDRFKKKEGIIFKKVLENFKSSKQLDGFKLILLTNYSVKHFNKSFELDDEKFKITPIKRCNSEKLFPEGDSYEFEVDDTASDEYRKLFGQFYLYSGQLNADQIENALLQKFQQEFGCEKSVFWEYFNFFTKWSKKEGRRNKLNKSWMKEIIAIHLLSPFVQSISFDSQDNEDTNILRKSINSFNITMFEETNTKSIANLWSVQSMKKELKEEDVKKINKLNTDYQIIPHIENLNDLKNDKFSMAVWLLDRCPLIIKHEKCVIKAIQFIKRKKFVVLYKDNIDQEFTNSFQNLKIFQNLGDLKNNCFLLYENLVKTFHCSLQGKPKISLETLVDGHQTIEKQITTDDLLLFLNDDLIIGEKEILPDIYIERYFSRHIINYTFLSEVDKDTVIVISNFNTSNKHLKQFQMEDIERLLQKDLKKEEYENRKICFCRNNCSQEKFEVICDKLSGKKKYHHFSIFEEKLEWICSRGGIQDLKKYQNQEKPIEDKVLYVSDSNIMIICGDPGLGKTTSMKYLKNSTYCSFWTFLIYPKDHSKYFRENQANIDNFIKYLLKEDTAQISQRFDSNILQILLNANRVNFIWDGLDEISEKNLKVVLAIIKEVSKKGWKQCITSRNNLRNKLECEFSAIATTIRQFNEEEQKLYLTKRLSCSEEELENIFTRIRNNISLFKDNHILSIPLQIYMFTNLFIHNPQKYYALLSNTFSLNDLYHHFIIQKFNIYFQEKENVCDTNDNTEKKNEEFRNYRIKLYQQVALQMYFSEEGVNCFDYNECEMFLTYLRKNEDSIGIITDVSSDNLPNFIHNSYGEYFAASYLSKNYKNIPKLGQFLLKEKFKNIRFFFDLILAKDCPAHIAVLCKNLEALKYCNIDSLTKEDQGGRHPLQLACSWGEMFPLIKVTEENDKRYMVHEEMRDRVEKLKLDHQNIVRYLTNFCVPGNTDSVYKLNTFSYADETLSLSTLAILSEKHIVNFTNLTNFKNIPVVLYYCAVFDFSSILSRLETIPEVYTLKRDSLLSLAASNGSLSSCKQLMIKRNFDVNTVNKDNDTPLHKACKKGHVEIVKLLIDNKGMVDGRNTNGDTPLHLASRNGHVKIVKLLIDNKAMVDGRNTNGDTPLHLASKNGLVEIVKLLIDNKAKADVVNKNGYKPLYLAFKNGHVAIVKLLIDNKANVDAVNGIGDTPLHLASKNGQVDIVKLLIGNKTNVNVVNKRDGDTPLHEASGNGHVEIVKLLIDNKANIDALNENGYTPLHVASINGHIEIVKLLIDNKANVDALNKYGDTPLHLASRNGHVEIVKLLIDNDAKVDAVNNNGYIPLHLASRSGHVETIKLLMDNNAKVDAVNKKGYTLLHLASRSGQVDAVKLLIDNKVKVDAVNEDGDTALHWACRNGHFDTVKLLMNNNANVDAVNKKGYTLLHLASTSGHVETVKLLIDNKAKVDAVNEDGDTPLHWASRDGHFKTVKLLIDNKAMVDTVNRNGYNSLHLASRNGHLKIVKLLIDKNAMIDAVNIKGDTPLHLASRNGHVKIVKLLIENNAMIDARNKNGNTPLHLASINKHIKIVKLLTENKAQVDAVNEDGKTLLLSKMDT